MVDGGGYKKLGWKVSRSMGIRNVLVIFWLLYKDFLEDVGFLKRLDWGKVIRWSFLWLLSYEIRWNNVGKWKCDDSMADRG